MLCNCFHASTVHSILINSKWKITWPKSKWTVYHLDGFSIIILLNWNLTKMHILNSSFTMLHYNAFNVLRNKKIINVQFNKCLDETELKIYTVFKQDLVDQTGTHTQTDTISKTFVGFVSVKKWIRCIWNWNIRVHIFCEKLTNAKQIFSFLVQFASEKKKMLLWLARISLDSIQWKTRWVCCSKSSFEHQKKK